MMNSGSKEEQAKTGVNQAGNIQGKKRKADKRNKDQSANHDI